MTWALVAGIVSFLVVPFLLPTESSGTKTPRELASLQDAFATLNGLDVRYQFESYTGDCECTPPVLVLLHGFGASVFSWRSVMEPLSEFGDVVAYDRPAFGLTERPTEWSGENPYGLKGNVDLLDAVVAQFGENRDVVLVGHSAGGLLAAEYSQTHPGSVSSLILVAPAILTTGGIPEGLGWLWGIPQIDRLGPHVVSCISSSGEETVRESFADQSKLTDEVYAGYRLPLQVSGWERAFWLFATAPRSNDVATSLSDLGVPVVLITGDADTIVPTAVMVALVDAIPNSVLEVIPRSGHLPHEEQPSAFVDVVETRWAELVR